MVQLLYSCGPLFKIIRACGPQPARNIYFRPKIIAFSKKKKSSLGIGLENIYFRPKIIAFSKKKKRFSLGIGLRNTYFYPKIIAFSKKKKVSTLDSVPSARHALLYKVAAAYDRQDLNCAKWFRGPVVGPRWSTIWRNALSKYANARHSVLSSGKLLSPA